MSNFGFNRAFRFADLAKKATLYEQELHENEVKENKIEVQALILNNHGNKLEEEDVNFDNVTSKASDNLFPLECSATTSRWKDMKWKRDWTKPTQANGNENGDVSKMAKVVSTAKIVDNASKSLHNLAIRKRLKNHMLKFAQERLTVKQIFRRYVESSTLHGFRYTCADTYFLRRFIWAVLMVLGAIYFIIKLKEGTMEYFSYPFSTLSTIEYVETLKLPAMSFCTVNQFNYTKVSEGPLYKLQKLQRLPIQRNWSDPEYEIDGETLQQEIYRTSFHIEDIFKECDYINRDTKNPDIKPRVCGTENFTSYFSETGQLCFTLNSEEPGHELLEVDHEGLQYGFKILFDLHNNDAIRVVDYTGLQVIVHDQSRTPKMDVGFMVSPGFMTYVSLEKIETKNLPPPFATQCGEKKLKYQEEYNQKACLLELLTDYTAELCHCREPYMPDNGFPYCSLRQKILCAFSAKQSFNEYEMRQQCPIDCEITSYNSRISDSRFVHNPPKGIEPMLLVNKSSHLLELSERHDRETLDHYIQENIIVIIFSYGEMIKIVNEQEASFDFYQFLGDMGGEIGLMLGASLLTFVEFIDLIFFLGYHQLLRLHKRNKEINESKRKSIVVSNLGLQSEASNEM